jgi:hypothetical protein
VFRPSRENGQRSGDAKQRMAILGDVGASATRVQEPHPELAKRWHFYKRNGM